MSTHSDENAEVKPTETIRTGGFQIDVSPDELLVTSDKSAFDTRDQSTVIKVFSLVAAALLGLSAAVTFLSAMSVDDVLFPSFVALAITWGLIFQRYHGTNNIRCTRDNLQVIRLIRGKITGQWTFPRELVSPISYAVFSFSRYDNTCGLLFTVQGKKVKVLEGLKVVEAQKVLDELDRLGFSVVRDVAMPMRVEMERERRRSILG